MKTPKPGQIKRAREAAKLTQTQAAELIYKTLRQWQRFENGNTDMDRALWELFNIKIKLL